MRMVLNNSWGITFAGTIGALTLILFCLGTRVQAQEADSKMAPTPVGSVEKGKQITKTHGCYSCHGYDAHGGTGPKLGPNPLPFTAFVRYTRQPSISMPPYTIKVISDQELADIYAFLQTLPSPPDIKSVPLLSD